MKKIFGGFFLITTISLFLAACGSDSYDVDSDIDSYEDAENFLEEEIRQEETFGDDTSDSMPNN